MLTVLTKATCMTNRESVGETTGLSFPAEARRLSRMISLMTDAVRTLPSHLIFSTKVCLLVPPPPLSLFTQAYWGVRVASWWWQTPYKALSSLSLSPQHLRLLLCIIPHTNPHPGVHIYVKHTPDAQMYRCTCWPLFLLSSHTSGNAMNIYCSCLCVWERQTVEN